MWLWLSVAGAMSLDAALQAAEQQSPVTRLADERVAEARSRTAEARGHLLPTATVSAAAVVQNEVSVNLGDQFPELPTAVQNIFNPDDFQPLVVQPGFQLQGAAELVQPLIAPQAWSAGGAARAGLALAEAERVSTKTELRRGVVEAWHQSAQARALVVDAEAGVELAQRLVERGQAMVGAGVASPDQVLPFERALASAQAALAQARVGQSAADGVLAELTGLEGGADAVPGRPDLPELDAVLGRMDRPDLAAAEERVDAARAARKIERSGLMPLVAAKAGIYALDPAPDLGEPINWKVSVGATLPLFQGGSVAARVSGAAARVSQAEAAKQLQQERAAIEVRSAHAQLDAALAALDARETAVSLAERSVAAAEARLDGGTGSLLAVQQAQAEQLQARAELTRAKSSAARARDLLALATSGAVR